MYILQLKVGNYVQQARELLVICMSGALKEIGERLRATREARGLDLADIADILKIRKLYLSAIESGDPAELPGIAYFSGYLKNYADMLGLDSEALLDTVQEILQPEPKQEELVQPAKKTMQEKIRCSAAKFNLHRSR